MPETPLDLVIIGAGFSGLGMAIRASQAGFEKFVILEKGPEVGGTWRENTYPGAASDIPSHLYSLSFAPNAAWSRHYPRQPEIQAYLKNLVTEHGLADRLRLDTNVRRAVWDEAAGLWRVETDRGEVTGRVLAAAVGGLHVPALPDLAGMSSFEGAVFHTARWDHSCDLTGKRIGVIGAGASAVQIVPEIVPQVAQLTLFQRSPPWVLPRGDHPIGPRTRWLLSKLPFLRSLYRQVLFWQHEYPALLGFTKVSRVTRVGEAIGRRHLQKAVADPALRERLTPRYRLGCKRVLVSDDYYPALARENAAVVTEPITSVGPHGITTADGIEHALDVLILATGFDTGGSYARLPVLGRDGRTLGEAWRGGGGAFQGMTVHGFPNFFLLLGPNSGLGHNSVLLMVEAQVAHVIDALRFLRAHPQATLDVTREAQNRFRARIDARTSDSIWTQGGCQSWYLDAKGRNRALWPETVGAFRRSTERLRLEDYETGL